MARARRQFGCDDEGHHAAGAIACVVPYLRVSVQPQRESRVDGCPLSAHRK